MIVFRVDASVEIGTGHVMRCLTLADELKKRGMPVMFLCQQLGGNLLAVIAQRGFPVKTLSSIGGEEEDAEECTHLVKEMGRVSLLVVDHYGLGEMWETKMRRSIERIMVIDDLANRRHYCDFLLDVNLVKGMESRYRGLIPPHCISFLGPGYALLRPEFWRVRRAMRKRKGEIERIMVVFGGSDPMGETARVMAARSFVKKKGLQWNVILGPAFQGKRDIVRQFFQDPDVRFFCGIKNMAQQMEMADLAITAGGSTTWERYCLGLSALLIAAAENQVPVCEYGQELGIDRYLGRGETVSPEQMASELENLLSSPQWLLQAEKKAMELVDGKGTLRVVKGLLTSL